MSELVKIRFTKDAEEVRALPDASGKHKKIKIPRGTIMEVKPASARYWITSVGAAELVREPGTRAKALPVPFMSSQPPAPSAIQDLVSISEGLAKQEFEEVYEAFKRLDLEAVRGYGLTSDSIMIIETATEEVRSSGGVETVSISDITDAVNEAIARGTQAPAGKPLAPPLAPSLPGSQSKPAASPPVGARRPGRPPRAAG